MKKSSSISTTNLNRVGSAFQPPILTSPSPSEQSRQDISPVAFSYHTPIQSPVISPHAKGPPPLRITNETLGKLQMNSDFFEISNEEIPPHLIISRNNSNKSSLFRLWPMLNMREMEAAREFSYSDSSRVGTIVE